MIIDKLLLQLIIGLSPIVFGETNERGNPRELPRTQRLHSRARIFTGREMAGEWWAGCQNMPLESGDIQAGRRTQPAY